MNTVIQKMLSRQSLIKYAEKHGATKAAIKYNASRQYVYIGSRMQKARRQIVLGY